MPQAFHKPLQAQMNAEPASSTLVFDFSLDNKSAPNPGKDVLGGKGANLMDMAKIGLPVPPGFTISSEVCRYFYQNSKAYPADLRNQIKKSLEHLEKISNLKFGSGENPLLLSVRSGARVSMPGMMDTILNIGLNNHTVQGLSKTSQNPRFAWDCYRRLIQMYGDVVLGVGHDLFEDIIDRQKRKNGWAEDTDVTAEGWQAIVAQFLGVVEKETGKPFPQDPMDQLWGAIGAVFDSWMTPRAVTYRKINDIPEAWGTAVTVQQVVFGNMGDTSGTGVAFTRNPSTGKNEFYCEFLLNAQGEDVVAGLRTPRPISELADSLPEAYAQLLSIRSLLEKHYRDMQDIEFTIQDKKLFMLQTRSGKRTAAAALQIAVDLANEGVISKDESILSINPAQLDQLLHPTIDAKAKITVITKGLPASPGAASGRVVFDADIAEKWVQGGHKVILCRTETSPEDIHGMHVAQGILTARGGMTSHAAVVARGMGKPCVCGAGDLRIEKDKMTIGGLSFAEGDWITINGSTGQVMQGQVPMTQPEMTTAFHTLMSWADAKRRLKVRTNADTPQDATVARGFGAEGIGLCRTEHMFFDPARIHHMRGMILAQDTAERQSFLQKLAPYQEQDFADIFTAMKGLPITIRLLDPPLHEFLPQRAEDIAALAKDFGISSEDVKTRIDKLHESNPMLGLRGCRLAVVYPEIYEMQIRAILNAAKKADAVPEIMMPLVSSAAEMQYLKIMTEKVALSVGYTQYTLGTMIELPRAALAAAELAQDAAFFSFGTNDLTQTTLGISRDDAGSFLPVYQQENLWPADPFATIDQDGVGVLVRMATTAGKSTRKDLKVGICGEHGGDPKSIAFFERAGLDYISCSPYRVPIARLAAAQAALSAERRQT
jgi:pyruvate,orthophosphate dikinase